MTCDGWRLMFAMMEFNIGAVTVQIAMIAGLPYTALREAILTHPTLIEGLNFLFASVPSESNQAMQTDAGRDADERLKKLA